MIRASVSMLSLILVAPTGCSSPDVLPALAVKPASEQSEGLPLLPCFLDSSTEIIMALDTPRKKDELKGIAQVTINGKEVAIRSIEPHGTPEKQRMLPRTKGRVILPGSIQAALGGAEWDPDGEVTQMTEDSKGVFTLVVVLPKGSYEYKIARDGSWNENYGAGFKSNGDNLRIQVPANGTLVKFVVDFNKKEILNSLQNPDKVKAPTEAPQRPEPPKDLKHPAAKIILEKPLGIDDLDETIEVVTAEKTVRPVVARNVLSQQEYVYTGEDLGSRYSPSATTFKVWSPVSKKAEVLLYSSAEGGEPSVLPMKRDATGTWSVRANGDQHGKFYTYRFESYGETRTATDIYSFAANRKSTRSMVVDLSKTNPTGWPTAPLLRHQSMVDAVLYEIHVRDFTAMPESGVSPENRGKYAGLVQPGTRYQGRKTGLDYLVDLGVTDIHLLPIHNFLTGTEDEYTWGYATNLFNVPEETYSKSPNDPVGVIREFKAMVQGMHKAGLRVVLDVVYNHTWPPQGEESNFWQTVPYYYFRTNDRGDVINESGVGNGVDDSKPMVRKFVRESLLFWTNEYKIDGFRFDLLGIHEPDAVRDYAKAVRQARPDSVLYGEPWTGGGPNRFGKGQQRGSGFAVFNDRIRGAFRGELDGAAPGFGMGGPMDRNSLVKAVTGWIDPDGFTDSPAETINYVSAHDNLTLLDRIEKSLAGTANAEKRRSATRFMTAGVMLSQGIPFLEGGVEMGRTKGGNGNSYNSGDSVNAYKWATSTPVEYAFTKGLIQLRKGHPVFRLRSAEEVRAAFSTDGLPQSEEIFSYRLRAKSGPYREYIVCFVGGTKAQKLALPKGKWNVLSDGTLAGAKPVGTAEGTQLVQPLSAFVFAR